VISPQAAWIFVLVLVLVLVLECPLIMPWGVEDEDEDESEDEDEIWLRLCCSGSSMVDPQKSSQEKRNWPFSGTDEL
jgi:hypothetical protein